MGKVRHPPDLPHGLPDKPQGRARRRTWPFTKGSPAMPRDRAVPDRRNATRVPARKIINHISIVPSPGRKISRMAGDKNCCGGVGWAGWASHRPPLGLPHDSPRTEPYNGRADSSRAALGLSCDSGCARSTGCHERQHARSVSRSRIRTKSVGDRLRCQVRIDRVRLSFDVGVFPSAQ
jgi:hypothetical protein